MTYQLPTDSSSTPSLTQSEVRLIAVFEGESWAGKTAVINP